MMQEPGTPIADAAETAGLAAEVEMLCDGDPWYGSSVRDLLADVGPADAAARPIATAHTIWELVLHMTGWAREVSRRLAGVEPAMPAEGDWPIVGDAGEEAWRKALAALFGVHRELSDAIRRMEPSRLSDVVGVEGRDAPLGTGVTMRRMLIGLLEHDAYHAGQIALLKKLTVKN